MGRYVNMSNVLYMNYNSWFRCDINEQSGEYKTGRDAPPIRAAPIKELNELDDFISQSISIEKTVIGYQGIPGSNSQVAAKRYMDDACLIPFHDFSDIFEAVEKEMIDLGILPTENSLEGSVREVNKLLTEYDINIKCELKLGISYSLLSSTNELDNIESVYSHPQALGQCKEYISRNDLVMKNYFDTAGAARMVSEEKSTSIAAIARIECADIYDLKILDKNIEDKKYNSTRFFILGKNIDVEGDKVSIVFSVKHEPGSLSKVLKLFSKENVNLTRIESIPNKDKPWRYNFLLDFEKNAEKRFESVLYKLENRTIYYRMLGCYDERRL